MIAAVKHIANLASALVREHVSKRVARSDQWPSVRKAHLKANPVCAACGSSSFLQVHHIKPFHIEPNLELDPTNLITLCMSKNECHLTLGHGDDFKAYNPSIVSDAIQVHTDLSSLPVVQARAKANRQTAPDIEETIA
jgi:hypothetical protein